MAILAQIYNLLYHQVFMTATVRGMAGGTILFHRRMFPNPWSALVSMAFVAELVDVFGFEHLFGQGAVGVVAVGTFYLAFDDGVMRHLVCIGPHILMTVEAHCGLFHGGARRVDIVAGGTAYVVLFVRAHIPQGKVC